MRFEDMKDFSGEARREGILHHFGDQLTHIGRSHPLIKQIRDIQRGRQGALKKNYIAEGLQLLNFARQFRVSIDHIVLCAEDIYTIEAQSLLEALIQRAKQAFIVSPKVFSDISGKDNSNGMLIMGSFPFKSLMDLEKGKKSIVVILDGLELPGNIGTIMRSMDATGADALIITNRRAHVNHPLTLRSSRGACFKIPVVEASVKETMDWLEKLQMEVILADTRAQRTYYQLSYKQPSAIVMGSERFGIDAAWYDYPHTGVSIPMLGSCDSLNVGIATTVLLYEASMKKLGSIIR